MITSNYIIKLSNFFIESLVDFQGWLKQIKKSVNPWESFFDVSVDKSKKIVTITPVVSALPPSLGGGILFDLDKKFASEVGAKKLY